MRRGFDQRDYTAGYVPGDDKEQDLVYSVLYSRNDGETWRYALDSQPAVPGERPAGELLFPDINQGIESLQLPTSEANYVGSEYLFRTECYHKTRGAHFSAHQVRVLLTR